MHKGCIRADHRIIEAPYTSIHDIPLPRAIARHLKVDLYNPNCIVPETDRNNVDTESDHSLREIPVVVRRYNWRDSRNFEAIDSKVYVQNMTEDVIQPVGYTLAQITEMRQAFIESLKPPLPKNHNPYLVKRPINLLA
jgi:hypothetical protein